MVGDKSTCCFCGKEITIEYKPYGTYSISEDRERIGFACWECRKPRIINALRGAGYEVDEENMLVKRVRYIEDVNITFPIITFDKKTGYYELTLTGAATGGHDVCDAKYYFKTKEELIGALVGNLDGLED